MSIYDQMALDEALSNQRARIAYEEVCTMNAAWLGRDPKTGRMNRCSGLHMNPQVRRWAQRSIQMQRELAESQRNIGRIVVWCGVIWDG